MDDFDDVFGLFDMDNSGSIPTKEVGTVLRLLRQTPSTDDVKQVIQAAGGGDRVEKAKLKSVIESSMQKPYTEDEIRDAFRNFDREKNGFLQVADLKQVMTTLGDRLTSEEMDALTEAADGEMISYDAFCKMLAAE
eukprot:CAMPEP_0204564362 /NCGR_PEP_ID=MMETSP0661-20131031/34844_1 /ASSEMBLY_ACC=CAM_ASM_000606 /TAXON_ID=109239 /ORGANISM="Alexandrium margalefi, Strain AMGDE01CS-322" /LENGTH=135 /DNA_ID=CAMNT_0051571997 /DNA_START=23 /DNA_END=430 /DNA_ORIENTATION=+